MAKKRKAIPATRVPCPQCGKPASLRLLTQVVYCRYCPKKAPGVDRSEAAATQFRLDRFRARTVSLKPFI